MKNTKNTIIGIASIIFGGMIYVLWRKQTLLMFSWFDAMSLGIPIAILRDSASAYSSIMPRWFYFSLPNALWAFGGILLFSKKMVSNPPDTALLVVFDDYISIQGEADLERLRNRVRSLLSDLRNFRWLAVIGWSKRTFEEFDLALAES